MTPLQDDRHISDRAMVVHSWLGQNKPNANYRFVGQ
jgi:hypothetical protein